MLQTMTGRRLHITFIYLVFWWIHSQVKTTKSLLWSHRILFLVFYQLLYYRIILERCQQSLWDSPWFSILFDPWMLPAFLGIRCRFLSRVCRNFPLLFSSGFIFRVPFFEDNSAPDFHVWFFSHPAKDICYTTISLDLFLEVFNGDNPFFLLRVFLIFIWFESCF